MSLKSGTQDMARLLCKFVCPLSRGLPSNNQSSLTDCSVYGKLHSELSRFGFREFRPGQLDAVLLILHGSDVLSGWQQALARACACSYFLLYMVHNQPLSLSAPYSGVDG